MPRYRFDRGSREPGPTVRLSRDHILLIEGIHGLNPALVPQVPSDSHLPHLHLGADPVEAGPAEPDPHHRHPADPPPGARCAGPRLRCPADHRAVGERAPGREQAHLPVSRSTPNVDFNSSLAYELAALKPLAEPLLRQVEPWTPEYMEARRLLAFLSWFRPCDGGHGSEVSHAAGIPGRVHHHRFSARLCRTRGRSGRMRLPARLG